MIAQVSHFKRLALLLNITDLFQVSRLFHRQWRNNPAVAVTVFIVNAYKRRADLAAQDAYVAPTSVGVAYLRFMKNVKTDTCTLYTHYRHIYARTTNLVIHKSLFCRGQTRIFVECDPGPQKTRKCRI